MTNSNNPMHALVRNRLLQGLAVVAMLLLILIEAVSALRGVYELQQTKANAERAQNEAAGTEWMKKKAINTVGIVERSGSTKLPAAALPLGSVEQSPDRREYIFITRFHTCADWIADKGGALDWAVGFLSGAALTAKKDFLLAFKQKPGSIVNPIDRECEANPNQKFVDALQSVITTLIHDMHSPQP